MKKMMTRGEEMYSSDVFKILFEYEISRSNRYPSPVSLLKIEMTPTALTEEALGAATSVFASALNAHLRSVDIPSKDGRVFTVLLPTSDDHGAHAVCERLLSVFKNKFNAPGGSSIAFSIQIGANAHAGGADLSGDIMLEKVDEALKQSKLKGQNTYVFVA